MTLARLLGLLSFFFNMLPTLTVLSVACFCLQISSHSCLLFISVTEHCLMFETCTVLVVAHSLRLPTASIHIHIALLRRVACSFYTSPVACCCSCFFLFPSVAYLAVLNVALSYTLSVAYSCLLLQSVIVTVAYDNIVAQYPSCILVLPSITVAYNCLLLVTGFPNIIFYSYITLRISISQDSTKQLQ